LRLASAVSNSPPFGRAYAAVEDGTVAEPNPENEPTIVERWLEDQQQWQRTVLAYLDAMTKNDDFLVHLGNAMRGSLLAGKPYPTAPPPPAAAAPGPAADAQAPADERLDEVLFALHQLQGQVADLQMTLDEIRQGRPQSTASASAATARRKAPPARAAAGKPPDQGKPARPGSAARSRAKSRPSKGRP
jgi:hypothetical protein